MNPNFQSKEFLLQHVQKTMNFYYPRCIDPQGGFFHYFKDDGTVYDCDSRHLVSNTRFIFNFAMAHRNFGRSEYMDALRHGCLFLRGVHRNPATGGYAWAIQRHGSTYDVVDDKNYCYGLAFVILAYAHALHAGIDQARHWLDEAVALAEARFWEPRHGLYADDASATWVLSDYRGQNANMHMCEAMLAAYQATGHQSYLDRAQLLAQNITERQAAMSGGLICEHYKEDWTPDWDYNRGDFSNIFKPWGFQTGHLTEWAKLLLLLERHTQKIPGVDNSWILPKARHLFDKAMEQGWDRTFGGLYYGFGPDGKVCDPTKYFWVQAESLAAAASLAVRTRDPAYWTWYETLWDYSWKHFVDHEHGAWYRILSADNRKLTDEKSPAGKTDYHTMGACYDILAALDLRR